EPAWIEWLLCDWNMAGSGADAAGAQDRDGHCRTGGETVGDAGKGNAEAMEARWQRTGGAQVAAPRSTHAVAAPEGDAEGSQPRPATEDTGDRGPQEHTVGAGAKAVKAEGQDEGNRR